MELVGLELEIFKLARNCKKVGLLVMGLANEKLK